MNFDKEWISLPQRRYDTEKEGILGMLEEGAYDKTKPLPEDMKKELDRFLYEKHSLKNLTPEENKKEVLADLEMYGAIKFACFTDKKDSDSTRLIGFPSSGIEHITVVENFLRENPHCEFLGAGFVNKTGDSYKAEWNSDSCRASSAIGRDKPLSEEKKLLPIITNEISKTVTDLIKK